ncbi:MAG: aminopeptidase, partial [Candidatus Nanoarchaeia archaeon]
MDLRTRRLAKYVVNNILDVKADENVVISGGVEAQEFIIALYKEVILKNAFPTLKVGFPGLSSFFYKYASKKQIEKFPDIFDYTIKKTQKYIGINTSSNTRELADADPKKITARQKVIRPITDYIVNGKPDIKRCSVAFPCSALAQDAEMSLVDYENFVYSACLQDWDKLGKKIKRVLNKFKKGRHVELKGKNVDLSFDIHGEKAKSDLDGENFPMGEVFMAPVRESLQGWIKFEYP